MIRDRYPVGVSSEIAKYVLWTAKGPLRINDPLEAVEFVEESLPDLRVLVSFGAFSEAELSFGVRRLQRSEELTAEEFSEDLHREEEVRSGTHPASAIFGESASCDDAMEVRVEPEVLSPRMEDGGETDLGSEVLLVAGDGLERLCCGTEEHAVHEALVAEGERTKLVGESEDDMEVMDGQEPCFSFVEPLGLFEALALRTVTITAGVVGDADVPAGVARILVTSERCGATVFDAPEDSLLAARESVASSKLLTVLAEYVRDLDPRPGSYGDHGCPLIPEPWRVVWKERRAGSECLEDGEY